MNAKREHYQEQEARAWRATGYHGDHNDQKDQEDEDTTKNDHGEHVRLLEKELHILELSFQVERLEMELSRLKQQQQDCTNVHPVLEHLETPCPEENLRHRGKVPIRQVAAQEKGAPAATTPTVPARRIELEHVIENMKRVMEKLRSENERLKTKIQQYHRQQQEASSSKLASASMSSTASMSSVAKVKEGGKNHREKNDHVQVLRLQVHDLRLELGQTQRKYRALLEKYKVLRQQQQQSLQSPQSPQNQSAITLASHPTDDSGTYGRSQEEPRNIMYDQDMLRLHQMQLEEKDLYIAALQQEIKTHRNRIVAQAQSRGEPPSPRHAARHAWTDDDDHRHRCMEDGESMHERSSTREQHVLIVSLQEENAALRDENAKLTQELSAFDLEFFDEIEDLKFKYAEAVRQKQALEKKVAL